VTTEWVVLLMIPVVPVKSLRVAYLESSWSFFRSSRHYYVVGPARMSFKEVARTYFLAGASIAGGLLLSSWLLGQMDRFAYTPWYDWIPVIALLAPLACYVIVFRLFLDPQ
jgi:hypothetical protein